MLLLLSLLALGEALRTVVDHSASAAGGGAALGTSGHFECSSTTGDPVAPPKAILADHEQGDGWHLIILVSGYWSNIKDGSLMQVATSLCEASFGAPDRSLIVVLDSNLDLHKSVEHFNLQAERAGQEVLDLLDANARQNRSFAAYSLVGHSLGGLVARSLATQLAEQRPALLPRTYISIFTPHLGLQGFVAEKVLPAFLAVARRFDAGGAADLMEEDIIRSALVSISAQKHREALERFQKRVLYASTSDWLVDFGSAAMTSASGPDDMADDDEGPESTAVEQEYEYPLLRLREAPAPKPVKCLDNTVRCAVLRMLAPVKFRRIVVEWGLFEPEKHSNKAMSFAEQMELHRHMATELGSAFALPRGARCAQDYCARGLECRQGRCQAKLLTSTACGASEECQKVGRQLNRIINATTLIVTSSGGGGHLVAARNLYEGIVQEAQASYASAQRLLADHRTLFTAATVEQLEATLRQMQMGKPPVETIDMMKSGCTDILGISMGDFMSKQWDSRQRAGDIEGLKKLVAKQPWTQFLFGSQCSTYIKKVLRGNNLQGLPVTRLYSTQPLLIASLLEAASKASKGRTDPVVVDLFMTDLPTNEAVHFFAALQSIKPKLDSEWKGKLILHSLPPAGMDASDVSGGQAEMERLSGVPREQISLEKFMPINSAFTKDSGLPAPGKDVAMRLKAQLPLEEEFLAELGNPLLVGDEDEVVLVMLGSQPTASAVKGYAEQSLELPEPAKGTRYVFLACGKPSVEAYANLYSDLVLLARGVAPGSRTVLVPFTGQDAKELLGRADISVTRSGGMTAGELLALRKRETDRKQALLHVEPLTQSATEVLAQSLGDNEDDEQSFTDAALEGMVPWEAGNARYLIATTGAKVVTPKIFASAVQNRSVLPFEPDWKLFLHLLGFGNDIIAYTQRQWNLGCKALACSPGIKDRPVRRMELPGGRKCQRALRRLGGDAPKTFGYTADVLSDLTSDPLAAFGLGDALAAKNRLGRVPNGFQCDGTLTVLRRRPSSRGAKFLKLHKLVDKAAQTAATACGARIETCGGFVFAHVEEGAAAPEIELVSKSEPRDSFFPVAPEIEPVSKSEPRDSFFPAAPEIKPVSKSGPRDSFFPDS